MRRRSKLSLGGDIVRSAIGFSGRSTALHLALVVAFSIALFGRSLGTAFESDAPPQLRWSETQSLASLFLVKRWIYRPLGFVVWKALFAILGHYEVRAYHGLNLLAHAANGALLYLIALRLSGKKGVALMAALLFASHPFNIPVTLVEVLFHPLMVFFLLTSLWLYIETKTRTRPPPCAIIVSCLALALAFLTHESGVVALILWLSFDLLFGHLSGRKIKGWLLSFLPYISITALYLGWWVLLPQVGESLSKKVEVADIARSATFFLQGIVFPIAPLATLLHDSLGVDPTVTFFLLAISTLLVLYLLHRQAKITRLFLFSIIWSTVSLIPATLLLSSEYIWSGARLFYLASVGAALLWAGALTGIGDLVADRLNFHPGSLRRSLVTVTLLPLLLVPNVLFIQNMLAILERASALIYEVARTATTPPDKQTVYINLPRFLSTKTGYPVGNFGFPIFGGPLEDVVYVHTGLRREVRAHVSRELLDQGVATYPSEATLLWSYFPFGGPLEPQDLVKAAIMADHLYILDPQSWSLTGSNWLLRDLDAYEPTWEPLSLAKFARGQLSQGHHLYLSLPSDSYRLPYPRWQPGRGLNSYDGVGCLPLTSRKEVHTLYLIDTSLDTRSLPLLQRHFPQGTVVQDVMAGETHFLVYMVPRGEEPVITPQHPIEAHLGDKVTLLGFDLDRESYKPGESIDLTLYWRAEKEFSENYTVFTHLLGLVNPATGTPLWGQHDSQPGSGSYPTSVWQEGEIIIDSYHIHIQGHAPPGEYQLEVGMYLLETGQRLPIVGSQGEPLQDSLTLAVIRVEG